MTGIRANVVDLFSKPKGQPETSSRNSHFKTNAESTNHRIRHAYRGSFQPRFPSCPVLCESLLWLHCHDLGYDERLKPSELPENRKKKASLSALMNRWVWVFGKGLEGTNGIRMTFSTKSAINCQQHLENLKKD